MDVSFEFHYKDVDLSITIRILADTLKDTNVLLVCVGNEIAFIGKWSIFNRIEEL